VRVLDLFCGAGGAAMGLHRAWPDAHIVGVDIKPQPRYPFTFRQRDAMTVTQEELRSFDFVWASPPCQKYSAATRHLANDTPKLIGPLREMLIASGKPYCIENTPGAPLLNPVTLCGLSFGLKVKRHRLFETCFLVIPLPCVKGHPGNWLVIFGRECRDRRHGHAAGRKNKLADGRAAMGIDWMSRGELSEAVPPAYSEYIARQVPLVQ
jgi:DNA (cytosine-5)-methyltransferase 1